MRLNRTLWCTMAVAALAVPCSAEPPRGSITIERIADIKYPTAPVWSPDGTRVAFVWDAAGKQDVFVAAPGMAPQALTDLEVDPDLLQSDVTSLAWASNTELLFGSDGQLWSVVPNGTGPPRSARIRDAASFALSPDRSQLAFLRRGQVWIGSVASGTARQITTLDEPLTASVPAFSLDGRWLAFTASRSTLEPESLPWNGTLVRSYQNATSDRRLGIVSTHGGDVRWLPSTGTVSNLQWAAGGMLIYQEIAPDGKTREIRRVAPGDAPQTMWRDRDEQWWSPTARDARLLVSPDGKTLAFVTDRTGWIHLYVLPVEATGESQVRQLTTGTFGVGLGSWSPDSRRIAYHHSATGNQMERLVSVVDVASGKTDAVVSKRGVSLDPQFSPDGRQLLLQHTSVEHSLDLYISSSGSGGAPPVRLTDSMPAGLDPGDLAVPAPVSFPSRHDRKPVPATLMVDKDLDRTRKHPAIVWVHGSGQDQNFLGWHPGSYRMYYSASVYLAQQGYVILTPDYRGSSGYSREWTTDVHKALGVIDTADVAAGADYLKTLPYVDPDRIGVWGLSYGGYLTLQALNADPLLWRCGINVAGVVDWATYGAGYTTPRLGTPVEHPDIYRISAPIYAMDRLERPLLVLHGTNDRNVAFRDSLRLIDVLLKLGKPFEMGVYPGEVHFFRRAHILRDAWRRAEEFFDRHLKHGAATTSQ